MSERIMGDSTAQLSERESNSLAFCCYSFAVFASFVLAHHLGWMSMSYQMTATIIALSGLQSGLLYYLFRFIRKPLILRAPLIWLVLIFCAIALSSLPIYLLFKYALNTYIEYFSWIPKIVLAWALLLTLTSNIYSLRKRRNFDKRLQALTTQAHMRILAEQLSPHFVFNALNSLRFMLAINPERARTMSKDISALIEELDSFSQSNLIPLRKDIAFLEKYLRLVKVQLGSTFDIRVRIDQSCSSPLVLPLVLQLLAENCVKHCLNKLEQGILLIHVREFKGQIIYRVCATNPENSDYQHKASSSEKDKSLSLNVGVNNIKSRLNLFYGENYHYRFNIHRQLVSTMIIFPSQPSYQQESAHGR